MKMTYPSKKYRNESVLVKDIIEMLRTDFQGFYFKSHGGAYQVVGLPDIIGCYKGRFIGIEVKLPGKEATFTRIQKDRIDKITRAGGVGFMTTSVSYVEERMRDVK